MKYKYKIGDLVTIKSYHAHYSSYDKMATKMNLHFWKKDVVHKYPVKAQIIAKGIHSTDADEIYGVVFENGTQAMFGLRSIEGVKVCPHCGEDL